MTKREEYARELADKLVEQIKGGTAPWQRPWEDRVTPHNAINGHRYRGINRLILDMESKEDPRWMTFKQAAAKGYHIEKGSKGKVVEYWQFDEEKIVDGVKIKERLDRPRRFTAVVFNGENVVGLPPLEKREMTWDANARAEAIMEASGAKIIEGGMDERGAFYSPGSDSIQLPSRDQFPSPAGFYGTALHELGHWTGHETRLDRDLSGAFGTTSYAKEELRAEIASMLISDLTGIPNNTENSTAYVANWAKVVDQDPNEIFRAARDAEAIFEFLVNERAKELMNLEENENTTVVPDAAPPERDEERMALAIPFLEKESAKEIAKQLEIDLQWDKASKTWTVPAGVDLGELEKYNQAQPAREAPAAAPADAPDKTFLAIPFAEKDEAKQVAKKAGVKLEWDGANKSWWVPSGAELGDLSKWKPEAVRLETPVPPQAAFTAALTAAGFVIEGDAQMDGARHRVAVDGDKKGEKSGSYVGHLDGRPNGTWINHLRSENGKWVSEGEKLDPKERAALLAEAAANREKHMKAMVELHDERASALTEKFAEAPEADISHPYLVAKGLTQTHGAKLMEDGRLVVPLVNSAGELRSVQMIDGQGEKRFAKDAEKDANFIPVTPLGEITNGQTIFIVEGFATAASLAEAGVEPVVAACDAGNLPAVAESLKQAFPASGIIVLGDDDRDKKTNTGAIKAEEAARRVGGKVILPEFGEGRKVGQTDFNDFGKAFGLARLKEYVSLRVSAHDRAVKEQEKGKDAKDDQQLDRANKLQKEKEAGR